MHPDIALELTVRFSRLSSDLDRVDVRRADGTTLEWDSLDRRSLKSTAGWAQTEPGASLTLPYRPVPQHNS
jgi:hypothetical protein